MNPEQVTSLSPQEAQAKLQSNRARILAAAHMIGNQIKRQATDQQPPQPKAR